MEIDTGTSDRLESLERVARTAEALGYGGVWAHESSHDPFLQCLRIALAAQRIQIGTAVCIAFARSPMTVAYSAYDLAAYCEGRFVLGLGSQVKAHIERRFSMPWSHPAERMTEFVQALRAIWRSWDTGEALQFEGNFYRHTLMQSGFSPPTHPYGPPPVYLAAVGRRMARVAGEVGDGLLFHAFNTPRYLKEVLVPQMERGAALSKRVDRPLVLGSVWLAVAESEQELDAAIRACRKEIAFHASTPAYRDVLTLHGYSTLQEDLATLARAGRWKEMPGLVDDGLVSTMAVIGSSETVGRELHARYAPVADRIILAPVLPVGRDAWPTLLNAARLPSQSASLDSGRASLERNC